MAVRKAAQPSALQDAPLNKKPPVTHKVPAHHGQKIINLALQGGGSHGAYTWGALEAILDHPRVRIEGITGASAGAMNAIVLAAGIAKDGAAGAIRELEGFWRQVSDSNSLSPLQRAPLDVILGNWSMASSPAYLGYDLWSRMVSPYQSNPLDLNPLRDMIGKLVDFKAMRKCDTIKLFVSATNVRTGRARVFERHELTPQVMAASACLPKVFQAVKIGRDHYWDGGYMGNPSLWPIIYRCDSRDLVIIQISPITRPALPRTAIEIDERTTEISFNASLMHEMRSIAFVTKLLKQNKLDPKKYKQMLMHRIHSERVLDRYDTTSKINTEWDFLQTLRKAGQQAGENFLRAHYAQLGKSSTLNIKEEYL